MSAAEGAHGTLPEVSPLDNQLDAPPVVRSVTDVTVHYWQHWPIRLRSQNPVTFPPPLESVVLRL